METEKRELLTNKNQPIKSITHQDIYTIIDTLEQLQSWTEPLELLDQFFHYKQAPPNKKKIIREYYASSQVFGIFLEDFLKRTDRLEQLLQELRTREKMRS